MFWVTYETELMKFHKYHDALAYIQEKMAYWNNFDDHFAFKITIVKDKDPNDLGAHAIETINAQDLLN